MKQNFLTELDLIESINLIALKNRLNPDFYSQIRAMQRQFSSLFHVSLLDVEKLDITYIMLHLYENYYSNLSNDDVLKAKHNLLKSKNNENTNSKTKEEEDQEWIKENEFNELKKEQEVLNKQKELPPDINMSF